MSGLATVSYVVTNGGPHVTLSLVVEEAHHFALTAGIDVKRVSFSGVRQTLAERAMARAADPEAKPQRTKSEAVAEQPRGEDGRMRPASSNTTYGESTNDRGADYWVRRLKRDAPEVAAQLAAGAFKSVLEARKAAGLVKTKPLVDQAFRLVERMSPIERLDVPTVTNTTSGIGNSSNAQPIATTFPERYLCRSRHW